MPKSVERNTDRPAVPLIGREVFFGNPDKIAPDLSPDGTQVAFLAPRDGVLNIWLAPVADVGKARPLTDDRHRGIRSFFWAHTGRHILYSQDVDGDENWKIYCIDLQTNKIRNLTPDAEGRGEQADPTGQNRVRARVESVSHRRPDEILIGLNDRDPRYHDVYRVNILTGQKQLAQKNPGYRGFVIDEDYRIRFASKFQPDGSLAYYQPAEGTEQQVEIAWRPFLQIPQEDNATTRFLGFDKSGQVLYLADSRQRDTAALVTLDLNSGEKKLIAADPRADVGAIKSHPTENTIQAVSFYYAKRERKFFDEEVQRDFQLASRQARGEMGIASWSNDDRQWIVADLLDNGPVRYFHFDRDTKQLRFLFVHRAALENLPLAHMHPLVITARDGLKLVSYLTLPVGSDPAGRGRPDQPLPMVLLVHGGPWARDSWGFDGEHQLWANRGYAVLSVNYRGSTGFGKNFQNIARRQWAGTMHDDLLDAVRWAVAEGIADREKIAITGGSYGGYATLVGLTFTPDVFACGVDIVGPSSLITLIEAIPPYWESFRQQLIERVGDIDTPAGRDELRRRSPLYHAQKIRRPLLIAQGKNDPRVKEAEAEQMVEAMQNNKIPVTYVLFTDEGHGLARPENRLAFYALTEAFLARHLGGRAEPIGSALEGSSLTVPVGVEEIPGLEAAF
ncbi:MAG: alpha/beta fold hydrolase [Planctomycetales bacterium]|nr:alpha/beta fold hydrolase [Planctomycetales bacterium]NIM10342.1 alpha/beta fold hydrolase [Planctomycetales bacterium]NIN09759.1 alpha/beta fold hydrolase [Planctomycetales bacterium]NIN78882.1 alpha/beta fold hydrolase [Planctomycetales bacterium]NIO36053.1 alpha/beta fold hydrolase [Planctomycetales bacterium]